MYWPTILITFVVFVISLIGMAIGVILSNRCLRGSCGGLSSLRDSQGRSMCEGCSNPSPECSVKAEVAEAAGVAQEDDAASATAAW